MELENYIGKKIRLRSKSGNIYEGVAYDFVPSQDNEPEVASFSVGDYEIYENEILDVVEIS